MAFNRNLPYIEILECPIHSLGMKETIHVIDQNIQKREPIHHVVVNAAKLVNMRKDAQLKESVLGSDIINADGQSVVWAASILGKQLPERVAGIDLMENLVDLAHKRGYKIFFFGAKEEVVKEVVRMYGKKYSPQIIAGYRNGYYSAEEEQIIAEQIGNSGADMLFVAITSPRKEIFLNTYKAIIQIPFVMGVGGSFDVVSGKTQRAPLWMQSSGLEWFYRVLQEPRRMWKRYLVTNTKFIWMLINAKIRGILITQKLIL